jgi:transposase-like protein
VFDAIENLCNGARQQRVHVVTNAVFVALERFPVNVNRSGQGDSLGLANQIRYLCGNMRGHAMAKGYSKDLRVRAIELVESGESAREAARILNLSASTMIRWMDRWRKTGNVEAKPGTGHSRSPLEAQAVADRVDRRGAGPDARGDPCASAL